MIDSLYDLVLSLARFDYTCRRRDLPASGIYFFFETGEQVQIRGKHQDRIVRVGTHLGDGNFPGRIRQHFGRVNTLGGNKNSSVFRRHVGGALIRRGDPNDVRLAEWEIQKGFADPAVEMQVSAWMRENLSFAFISVLTRDERLSLERGLIALLAQQRLGESSAHWLGRYAKAETIRETGLWNTRETNAAPLTELDLELLKGLAQHE